MERIGSLLQEGAPSDAGYYMPPEWYPQEGTWLAWPHNEETFGGYLNDVEEIYCKFIAALLPDQKVFLLVNDGDMEKRVISRLNQTKIDWKNNLIFYQIPTIDVWIRDYGPTYLLNNEGEEDLAIINWQFNAWGGKYLDLAMDTVIPYELNKQISLPVYEPSFILEGGSIDVNESGCVLTTKQCLLNDNRNPEFSQFEIEQVLLHFLGKQKVLWLGEGIEGDDTDGHVDDIARFVNDNTIACAYTDDKTDPNFPILDENYKQLEKMTNIDGKSFNVVKIPMPEDIFLGKDKMPASYLNFYIGTEVVVIPIFNCPTDKIAIKMLEKLFPNRKVLGIDCTCLVYGFGGLHCVSQQVPKKL